MCKILKWITRTDFLILKYHMSRLINVSFKYFRNLFAYNSLNDFIYWSMYA